MEYTSAIEHAKLRTHVPGNAKQICENKVGACMKPYIFVHLLRELPDVLLQLGRIDFFFPKAVEV